MLLDLCCSFVRCLFIVEAEARDQLIAAARTLLHVAAGHVKLAAQDAAIVARPLRMATSPSPFASIRDAPEGLAANDQGGFRLGLSDLLGPAFGHADPAIDDEFWHSPKSFLGSLALGTPKAKSVQLYETMLISWQCQPAADGRA